MHVTINTFSKINSRTFLFWSNHAWYVSQMPLKWSSVWTRKNHKSQRIYTNIKSEVLAKQPDDAEKKQLKLLFVAHQQLFHKKTKKNEGTDNQLIDPPKNWISCCPPKKKETNQQKWWPLVNLLTPKLIVVNLPQISAEKQKKEVLLELQFQSKLIEPGKTKCKTSSCCPHPKKPK